MKVLIAYATSEGQTRKISSHMGDLIRSQGHEVEIHDTSGDAPQEDIASFDAVILAASVHQQRYQPGIYRYLSSNLDAIRAKPSAFVSVSLSMTITEGEAEAEKYYQDFTKETGWSADMVHLAEGAIRYSEYDFFKVQIIEHVVLKGKMEMPSPGTNPEFTDWKALDGFTTSFLAHAEAKAAAAASG